MELRPHTQDVPRMYTFLSVLVLVGDVVLVVLKNYSDHPVVLLHTTLACLVDSSHLLIKSEDWVLILTKYSA